MTTLNLTDREKAMILKFVDNDYNSDQSPDSPTWTFAVAESHAERGVLGSLVKKGLATTWDYDPGQEACQLTAEGKAIWAALNS